MRQVLTSFWRANHLKMAAGAVMLTAGILSAQAQTPPAALPAASPVKQAIDVRKAAYLLIGNNFRPVGDILKGSSPYNAAEVQKRAARVAFLAELTTEVYPAISNAGSPATRAKAEIWKDQADFDKHLRDFVEHSKALVQVAARETAPTDAFKAAAGAVAQDCKNCHDKYREK